MSDRVHKDLMPRFMYSVFFKAYVLGRTYVRMQGGGSLAYVAWGLCHYEQKGVTSVSAIVYHEHLGGYQPKDFRGAISHLTPLISRHGTTT